VVEHIPWSDGTIYWDTSGCCDGTQRIQKHESDPGMWRGRWNHYAFVKDRDRKQIWQNGALFHEATNTADLTVIRGFIVVEVLRSGAREAGDFGRLRFREEGVKVQRWTAMRRETRVGFFAVDIGWQGMISLVTRQSMRLMPAIAT
jgi:hypothetical protein